MVVNKGYNGNELKLNYKNLNNIEIQKDLGVTVLQLMSVIPEGIIIFFPSYKTMSTLIDEWIDKGILNKMRNLKNVYIEPKGNDEFVTEQFMQSIEKYRKNCGMLKIFAIKILLSTNVNKYRK